MPFHHLFHNKTNASKPRTVSSKQEFSKRKNCLKSTRTDTEDKNYYNKTKAIFNKKQQLSQKKQKTERS